MRIYIFILSCLIVFSGQTCLANKASVLSYISSVKTFEATFLQYNPDQTTASGKVRIIFPGRLRLDYDQYPFVVCINKGLLVYHDLELLETTNIFLGKNSSILKLLNSQAYIEKREISENQGFIEVRRSDEERICTLRVCKDPFEIYSVKVEDLNGDVTVLKFYDAKYNLPINKRIFTEF